jgi:hypothetical protein
VLDCAATVEEDAYLASDVVRELGQLASQLIRDDSIIRDSALAETFERFDLTGLESSGVSVDLDGVLLRSIAKSRPGGRGG